MSRDRSVLDVVFVSLALVAVLTPYRSLISGPEWFSSTMLVLALVTLTIVIGRLAGLDRRAKGLPLTIAATSVALLITAAEVVPQTMRVLLPTSRTLSALADLSDDAKKTIAVEPAPVDAVPEIVFTVALAFAALLIAADVLLRTRFAIGAIGLMLLGAFLVPSLIVASAASMWTFVVAAALWLTLLARRSQTTTRLVPVVAVAMCGLAGAVVFPLVAPDIRATTFALGAPRSAVFGQGINPMVELGSDLRRGPVTQALSLRTDMSEAPYLKVATLTDFTGKTWRPSENYDEAPSQSPQRIDPGIKVETRYTIVKIDSLRSEMLPTPYPPTGISGLAGELRWEQTGQTVLSERGDSRGKEYTVTSLEVTPTAAQLRRRNSVPSGSSDAVIDPEIEATVAYRRVRAAAEQVAGSEPTVYDKAMALQGYLRDGDFEYSLQAPVDGGYDGSGIDVLAEFLDKRSGYCVHFASAMTVMARSLNMPARIAVGYGPGERGGLDDGKREYRVYSDDLHAWTEVYFAGVGWVRFDPTPGIGTATELDEEEQSAAGPEPTEPTEDTTQPEQEQQPEEESAANKAESDSGGFGVGRGSLAFIGGLAIVAGAPAGLRRLIRWWRLRPSSDVEAVWREVEDSAIDSGVTVTSAQTPRNVTAEIVKTTSVDRTALWDVLHQLERSRFSDQPGSPELARNLVHLVLDSMLAHAPRAVRWRARWLPRSLLRARTDSAPAVSGQPA